MEKLLLVFDYFKEAFHLNKQNKALYKPQFALIAIRVLMIVIFGIGAYRWIGIENINNLTAMQPEEIFSFIFSQGLKVLGIILAYSVISVVVESGLLNMYKKAVVHGYTERGDFMEGVSKYFLRLVLGELFIIICYILAIPFYLIIGFLSLTAGLTVIPLAAGIFLSMWKVSLVMNDNGIFGAIGDSFKFAKKNFMPLAFLQVIHWAFTQGAAGGRSGNINFNNNSGNMTGDNFFGQPGIQHGLEQGIQVMKIVIAILIPIAALATIGTSIIGMIFEVFFILALFVAYKNGFHVEAVVPELIEAAETEEAHEETLELSEENASSEAADSVDESSSENDNNEEVEQ